MPLRDTLAALVGRWREPALAAAAEPVEPAPSPAEPGPPPIEPAPRPRIVLLGTEPRAIGLMELYGLAGRGDVVLSDRRPGRDAGEAWGRRVWNFNALALDGLEVVVVTEDPIGHYAEALRFLEEKGVPPERIATAAQPGRAHRALSRWWRTRRKATGGSVTRPCASIFGTAATTPIAWCWRRRWRSECHFPG